ncbi:hypothetical protein Zmor_011908 [Zophobas morio]|uniref:Valine--tRNA ligase, mitochondrial n=1 Tax=Zophobas morio TaxID=2755281 RepID=A0AA38HIR6_9CUCU|nr:hypothetical protein Zmor_011908 [Zophobas morio]
MALLPRETAPACILYVSFLILVPGLVPNLSSGCDHRDIASAVFQRLLKGSVGWLLAVALCSSKNAEKNQRKAASYVPFENKTVKGEKKDVINEPMLPSYNPAAVESSWYDWWEKKRFFKPEGKDGIVHENPKGKFIMVIPPPNVTGSLHLGHALTIAIQDTLARWNRMLGKTVLWNPGCDHAGIATQVVVEKKLWKEQKLTRHQLGRENFVQKIWEWKQIFGERIYNQIRGLGASVDWDRACFTMDEKMRNAVTAAFIAFYEKGLIKRANRMVNWSPALLSAISDLEVDYLELPGRTLLPLASHGGRSYEFGVMVQFAYKVEDSEEEIIVATTRPETLLGDVCVAVHPDDARWKHLHGKFVVHPFLNKRLPILTDECVEISLGTGALKITPGHDKKDFDFGVRHQLPIINIFNDDGTMNGTCSRFEGLKRYDARIAVIEALKEAGLYRGAQSHAMAIPICSRSKDVVEDMVRPQWFLNCGDMAKRALAAVESGSLKIIPSSHNITWKRWLENSRDWCVSRQLWWGHRIPAYKIIVDGQEPILDNDDCWVVCESEQEALTRASQRLNINVNRITVEQDPDVLDTWFSSGLFPLSVFGWPEKTDDFMRFFPGTFLETGHDILFFWVARMVMMSLSLTNQLPFSTVYLHALVRDAHGRKMSKSLGNVIDPVDVIRGISLSELHKTLENGNLDEKEIAKAQAGQTMDFPNGIPECGTDALRYTLVSYTIGGKDVNLDINRIVAHRHFCNKIWNANKLYYFYCSGYQPASETPSPSEEFSCMDRWILSRLYKACEVIDVSFNSFLFTQMTDALYKFWKEELCDVYLESSKPVLQGPDGPQKINAMETLYTCIETGLRQEMTIVIMIEIILMMSKRLLHPIMPFITEELWQRLPKRSSLAHESICIADYPKNVLYRNVVLEEQQVLAFEVAHCIRALRSSYLEPKARPKVTVIVKNTKINEALHLFHNMVECLCELSELVITYKPEVDRRGHVIGHVADMAEVLLLIKGLVDSKKEITKLEKKKASIIATTERLERRLNSPVVAKIPESILVQERARVFF